jgi:hypothetical protein
MAAGRSCDPALLATNLHRSSSWLPARHESVHSLLPVLLLLGQHSFRRILLLLLLKFHNGTQSQQQVPMMASGYHVSRREYPGGGGCATHTAHSS